MIKQCNIPFETLEGAKWKQGGKFNPVNCFILLRMRKRDVLLLIAV